MPFFISIEKTVEAVIIAVAFAVLSCLCANKVLGALQALCMKHRNRTECEV